MVLGGRIFAVLLHSANIWGKLCSLHVVSLLLVSSWYPDGLLVVSSSSPGGRCGGSGWSRSWSDNFVMRSVARSLCVCLPAETRMVEGAQNCQKVSNEDMHLFQKHTSTVDRSTGSCRMVQFVGLFCDDMLTGPALALFVPCRHSAHPNPSRRYGHS